jgi:hypothetical protein
MSAFTSKRTARTQRCGGTGEQPRAVTHRWAVHGIVRVQRHELGVLFHQLGGSSCNARASHEWTET